MEPKYEISERVLEAVQFAVQAHGQQARKGTLIPYVTHPLSVAKILVRAKAPEDLVIAGILHDVVEDTDATLEKVLEAFGPRVAELVKGVSEPDKGASWRERKEHTHESVGCCSDLEILALKCADKLDNVRDIYWDFRHGGDSVWERFKSDPGDTGFSTPREAQQWYYGTLADAFLEKLTGTQWADLAMYLSNEVALAFGKAEVTTG